jgi:hypothetical protein
MAADGVSAKTPEEELVQIAATDLNAAHYSGGQFWLQSPRWAKFMTNLVRPVFSEKAEGSIGCSTVKSRCVEATLITS